MGHMKFPLPDELEPTGQKCIRVVIPDDLGWRSVFWGNFWNLCSAANHGDDDAHTALTVADKWKEIYYAARESECGLDDVRQNPTSPCILEKLPSGGTWEQFADLKLCPPQIRNKGGTMQYSTDGGSTWQNVDTQSGSGGYDPRVDEPLLPARGGSNIPCLAAANATACIVELHREVVKWYNDLAVPMVLLGALALALGVFFPVSWMVMGTALSATTLATIFLTHVASLNDTAFTTAIQDQLTCILACRADASGRWADFAFAGVLTDVAAESGDMWGLIHDYLENLIGVAGLNNAGTTTSVSSHDCSGCSCNWCYVFNFLPSQAGWSSWHVGYGGSFCDTVWDAGQGWGNATCGLSAPSTWFGATFNFLIDIPVTKVTVGWRGVERTNAGNSSVLTLGTDRPPNGDSDIEYAINATLSGVMAVGAIVQDWGHGHVAYVKLTGTGDNPFGANNC